jgi:hypothetical protein
MLALSLLHWGLLDRSLLDWRMLDRSLLDWGMLDWCMLDWRMFDRCLLDRCLLDRSPLAKSRDRRLFLLRGLHTTTSLILLLIDLSLKRRLQELSNLLALVSIATEQFLLVLLLNVVLDFAPHTLLQQVVGCRCPSSRRILLMLSVLREGFNVNTHLGDRLRGLRSIWHTFFLR